MLRVRERAGVSGTNGDVRSRREKRRDVERTRCCAKHQRNEQRLGDCSNPLHWLQSYMLTVQSLASNVWPMRAELLSAQLATAHKLRRPGVQTNALSQSSLAFLQLVMRQPDNVVSTVLYCVAASLRDWRGTGPPAGNGLWQFFLEPDLHGAAAAGSRK